VIHYIAIYKKGKKAICSVALCKKCNIKQFALPFVKKEEPGAICAFAYWIKSKK